MIDQKNLYDLKAIPTLYLLDKDKNSTAERCHSRRDRRIFAEEYLKRIRHSGHNKDQLFMIENNLLRCASNDG